MTRDSHVVPTRSAGAAPYTALVAMLVALLSVAQLACIDSMGFTAPQQQQSILIEAYRDTGFDFTALHTFAMPDTIVHRGATGDAALDVTRRYDRAIIARARADLVALGFSEITDPQRVRPDFVVLIESPCADEYSAWSAHPWYDVWGFYQGWGWYAPKFDVDWSLMYPWYPAVGVANYAKGSLLFSLVPTTPVNETEKRLKSSWAGAASALLDRELSDADIRQAIDIMFMLSPYLKSTAPVVMR
jgi:hypothetical protein